MPIYNKMVREKGPHVSKKENHQQFLVCLLNPEGCFVTSSQLINIYLTLFVKASGFFFSILELV